MSERDSLIRSVGRQGEEIVLGPMEPEHLEDLRAAFADAVDRGEGYPHTPPLTDLVFEQVWVEPVTLVVAATVDGAFAGAYYLKPNGPGLGAHIANAGYLVARSTRGRGIGRRLVEDSTWRSAECGFDAVQFNFVFESNPARAMYREMGWLEVGRIPGAVTRMGADSPEDAIIFWRQVP